MQQAGIANWKAARIVTLAALTVVALSACGMVRMITGTGAVRPAESEFGMGPRVSLNGLYRAQLESDGPIRTRALQSVRVQLADASGKPVEGARIDVDGGMPQHGHGLPTRPRMTSNHGNGVYQIDGVRFNMGGWWELRLAITTPAGADSVTFNLSL